MENSGSVGEKEGVTLNETNESECAGADLIYVEREIQFMVIGNTKVLNGVNSVDGY